MCRTTVGRIKSKNCVRDNVCCSKRALEINLNTNSVHQLSHCDKQSGPAHQWYLLGPINHLSKDYSVIDIKNGKEDGRRGIAGKDSESHCIAKDGTLDISAGGTSHAQRIGSHNGHEVFTLIWQLRYNTRWKSQGTKMRCDKKYFKLFIINHFSSLDNIPLLFF